MYSRSDADYTVSKLIPSPSPTTSHLYLHLFPYLWAWSQPHWSLPLPHFNLQYSKPNFTFVIIPNKWITLYVIWENASKAPSTGLLIIYSINDSFPTFSCLWLSLVIYFFKTSVDQKWCNIKLTLSKCIRKKCWNTWTFSIWIVS